LEKIKIYHSVLLTFFAAFVSQKAGDLQYDTHGCDMKHSINLWAALLIFSMLFPSIGSSQEGKLVGVWESYKQEDKTKAPSCFYSLEFREDGTMDVRLGVRVLRHSRPQFAPESFIRCMIRDVSSGSIHYIRRTVDQIR